MVTAGEMEANTKRYLAEIKSRMGICPMLEENDMKMLHMNAPLGDWREWRTLTYNHSILRDMLVKENEELRKIKDDLQNKIKTLTPSPLPPFPFTVNPMLNVPMVQGRSLQVVEEKGNKLEEDRA